MSILLHVSPSVLDKFQAWLESESSWEEYYGQSENPPFSLAEWDQKLEQELVDACNGVQSPSTRAANLGTCLNEALDCILLGVSSTREDVQLESSVGEIHAKKDLDSFRFHTTDVINLKSYVENCTPQKLVSATINTDYGEVQLYGYPDYFTSAVVTDLKTTSRYEGGKFRDKWQRYVYPYILDKNGLIPDYKNFTFLVCKVSGDNKYNPFVELELFKETYTDPLASFESIIRGHVERFIEWWMHKSKEGVVNSYLKGERTNKK